MAAIGKHMGIATIIGQRSGGGVHPLHQFIYLMVVQLSSAVITS